MSRGSSNGWNGTWKPVGGRYNPVRFEVDGHEFGFYQLHTDDYGYMGMADYPSDMAEDRIKLAEVRGNMWETASSEFNKEMTNKIYYNATHVKFTFDEFITALEKEGIKYRKD